MVSMVPILPSADFDRTVDFYQRIGLRESGRWPGEYLIVDGMDGMELHFWASPGVDPSSSDASCYVRCARGDEAVALHERWSQADLPPGTRLTEPGQTDYGMVEFGLVDPDGNLIRVGGPA